MNVILVSFYVNCFNLCLTFFNGENTMRIQIIGMFSTGLTEG